MSYEDILIATKLATDFLPSTIHEAAPELLKMELLCPVWQLIFLPGTKRINKISV